MAEIRRHAVELEDILDEMKKAAPPFAAPTFAEMERRVADLHDLANRVDEAEKEAPHE